jgi:hypothetical protein
MAMDELSRERESGWRCESDLLLFELICGLELVELLG